MPNKDIFPTFRTALALLFNQVQHSAQDQTRIRMRNIPVQKSKFCSGNNYVSIGFVDMMQLLVGSLEIDPSLNPIMFVGYDKSDVVVARNYVIYDMILRESSPNSILQVWFSAGWNKGTLEDFQRSCTRLVQNADLQAQVRELLCHWMTSKRNYKSVQPLVTRLSRERMFNPMKNLQHRQDRVDYARYIFTGCIFGSEGEEYVYGNTTLFSLPKGHENHDRQEESIFATISMHGFTYNTSLMKSATELVFNGLLRLISTVRAEQVICKFDVKELKKDDTNTLQEIKRLNPLVIDWSNVPEYLTISDFFTMAMSCSGKNTTHQAHYMNWVYHVLGASLVDYPGRKKLCFVTVVGSFQLKMLSVRQGTQHFTDENKVSRK